MLDDFGASPILRNPPSWKTKGQLLKKHHMIHPASPSKRKKNIFEESCSSEQMVLTQAKTWEKVIIGIIYMCHCQATEKMCYGHQTQKGNPTLLGSWPTLLDFYWWNDNPLIRAMFFSTFDQDTCANIIQGFGEPCDILWSG